MVVDECFRWEECLAMMQKLQQQQQHQLLSSPSYNLPYSSIFPPPSLIHPLLQPSAISSPFFFAPDRSSASVALSSNAFDLSNVFSRFVSHCFQHFRVYRLKVDDE